LCAYFIPSFFFPLSFSLILTRLLSHLILVQYVYCKCWKRREVQSLPETLSIHSSFLRSRSLGISGSDLTIIQKNQNKKQNKSWQLCPQPFDK
jgi:hypothetical protein